MDRQNIGGRRVWIRHAVAGALGLLTVALPVVRGLTLMYPPRHFTNPVAMVRVAAAQLPRV
jgi:hypothetical protein